MNTRRAYVYFKAAVYMALAAITPLAVALERWIEHPPANQYEVLSVSLASLGSALVALKSFMSDSQIETKPPSQ